MSALCRTCIQLVHARAESASCGSGPQGECICPFTRHTCFSTRLLSPPVRVSTNSFSNTPTWVTRDRCMHVSWIGWCKAGGEFVGKKAFEKVTLMQHMSRIG
eukprot:355508-Chlamydomonas_euryale.AAC.5